MKRIFTLSFVLCLMSSGLVKGQGATQNLVYEAKKLDSATKITVDGQGNEGVWSLVKATPLSQWVKGSSADKGHSFEFKLLWGDEGIYFLGSRTDDTLALKEKDLQWDGHAFDQVVLYFNPYGERDSEAKPYPKWEAGKGIGDCYWGSNSTMAKLDIYEGGVTTVFNGAWMDGRFGAMDVYNPDTKTYVPNGQSYNGKSPNDAWVRLEKDYGQKLVSKTNGTNFTVEAFIPFSVMVPKNMATTPSKWGFEIESIDNEWEGQGKKSILAFNNDTKNDNSWYFINNFGTLQLKDVTVTKSDLYTNQENIKLYIFSNELHINSTATLNTINVFDLLGNKVMRINNLKSNSVIVDISNLNSGMYIIQTSDSNGKVNARKVYKK